MTLQIRSDGVSLDKSTIGLDRRTHRRPSTARSRSSGHRASGASSSSFPARQVDFDGDPNGGPFVFEDVQWCAGTVPVTGPIHQADARFSNGLLPWCLVSETIVLQPDGKVVQTQLYDGYWRPLLQVVPVRDERRRDDAELAEESHGLLGRRLVGTRLDGHRHLVDHAEHQGQLVLQAAAAQRMRFPARARWPPPTAGRARRGPA